MKILGRGPVAVRPTLGGESSLQLCDCGNVVAGVVLKCAIRAHRHEKLALESEERFRRNVASIALPCATAHALDQRVVVRFPRRARPRENPKRVGLLVRNDDVALATGLQMNRDAFEVARETRRPKERQLREICF